MEPTAAETVDVLVAMAIPGAGVTVTATIVVWLATPVADPVMVRL